MFGFVLFLMVFFVYWMNGYLFNFVWFFVFVFKINLDVIDLIDYVIYVGKWIV